MRKHGWGKQKHNELSEHYKRLLCSIETVLQWQSTRPVPGNKAKVCHLHLKPRLLSQPEIFSQQ